MRTPTSTWGGCSPTPVGRRSWDIPTNGGERGRIYGQKSGEIAANTRKPPLPPGVAAGGHGGSHGHLTTEFVDAILRNRKPWIDVALSLNLTVAGIAAHQSALKNGELLKIPAIFAVIDGIPRRAFPTQRTKRGKSVGDALRPSRTWGLAHVVGVAIGWAGFDTATGHPSAETLWLVRAAVLIDG